MPFTPGEDIVGVVDKLGEGVSTVEPGQMVAGVTFGDAGGYAEFICLPASELVPVPSGVDPAEAVCLVVNYLTAHMAMHRTANVRSGERILVHGAAGGVGSALLELGKLAGLEMYGTASKYNHELVSALGATPIDYRTEDFVERIRSLTGDGVDAVFDPIGGARQIWRSYRALRKGGRLVWFGMAATTKAGRAGHSPHPADAGSAQAHSGRQAGAYVPGSRDVRSGAQRLVPRNADGAPRFAGSGQDQAGGGGAHSVG